MSFTDLDMGEYETLEEYFLDHPDEENEFYDEMFRLSNEMEVEFPEDYPMYA